MKLLPTQQITAQLVALRLFINQGKIRLSEPCDCGGQTRHNNGGNYHEEIEARADGGKWFILRGSTSEYEDAEWEEQPFVKILDIIQDRASRGYHVR